MTSYNTQELIQDLKASGLTHKSYCTQKGIPASTLAYHLRKHRSSLQTEGEKPSTQSFIPVDLQTTNRCCRTLIILKGELSCDDLIKIASSIL
jgi:hypothetical protein